MTTQLLPADVRADWLARTADAIEAAGPEHFDMAEYAVDLDVKAQHPRRVLALWHLRDPRSGFDVNACGSTACIAGWLVIHAPAEAIAVIDASDLDLPWSLANSLGFDNNVWHVDLWDNLGPSYSVLDPDSDDLHGCAVAFLRRESARAAAEVQLLAEVPS